MSARWKTPSESRKRKQDSQCTVSGRMENTQIKLKKLTNFYYNFFDWLDYFYRSKKSAAQIRLEKPCIVRYMHVSSVCLKTALALLSAVRSFIYSFRLYLQCLLKSTTTHRRSQSQQLTLCRSFHTEALQGTVSEGLFQGPYMAARARFEPRTFHSKDID